MGCMTELVHLEADGGVATVTLDSPHNKNALSQQLTGELLERLEAAGADDSVRVIVIRSALDVFCSGADLSEATTVGMGVGAQRMVDVQRAIVANPKPVVARVAGPVRAGGIGIVAAADISIAGESASFALTEVRLGLAAATISLTVLPRLTDRAAAYTFLRQRVRRAGSGTAGTAHVDRAGRRPGRDHRLPAHLAAEGRPTGPSRNQETPQPHSARRDRCPRQGSRRTVGIPLRLRRSPRSNALLPQPQEALIPPIRRDIPAS